MKLQIGPIKLSTDNGPIVIAGWHNDLFGVDWRACMHRLEDSPGAYVVTHLKTGWAVVALIANIEDVELLLEQLREVGDWTAADRQAIGVTIGENREAMRAIFDTLPHHDPKCFCMAAGDHGAGAFGNA